MTQTLEKYGWLGQVWCRVVHGHLMVKFGSDKDDGHARAWYMCARCLKCEILHEID
jgi:hypothetical protein